MKLTLFKYNIDGIIQIIKNFFVYSRLYTILNKFPTENSINVIRITNKWF